MDTLRLTVKSNSIISPLLQVMRRFTYHIRKRIRNDKAQQSFNSNQHTDLPGHTLEDALQKISCPTQRPLFGRHSPIASFTGTYFTPHHFQNSLQSLLSRANIDPEGFTSHSMRRGGAQSAAEAGLTTTK